MNKLEEITLNEAPRMKDEKIVYKTDLYAGIKLIEEKSFDVVNIGGTSIRYWM